jgi:hypothetical protein
MIKTLTLTFTILLSSLLVRAQDQTQAQVIDSITILENTFRSEIYASRFGKTQLGGYAQIDYNQPLGNESNNGVLDVHRLVLFIGHKFNDRLSFFSEIEVEHVKEIFVEQAFLEMKLTPWLNLRSGLILIPMGIVNEYHEPPTFNGVERPNLEKHIIPTTWREIGLGFSGNLPTASFNYQIYVMNGPLSYDNGEALFGGKSGMRSGRQKGAKSTFSGSPNLSMKVSYYGFRGLSLGLSGYFGESQSTLYNGLDENNINLVAEADSSVVGISMIGFDARYRIGGFQARGVFNITQFSNTIQYNTFTGSDLGSDMLGYYAEVGYNIFAPSKKIQDELIVFSRYEVYNTHQNTTSESSINSSYNRTDITVGLHYKPTPNTSFKADYQIFNNDEDSNGKHQLNFGVGVWF